MRDFLQLRLCGLCAPALPRPFRSTPANAAEAIRRTMKARRPRLPRYVACLRATPRSSLP